MLTLRQSFLDANSFSCPANTDNKCTSEQSAGWNFGDLALGGFSQYNDLSWSGFTCQKSFSKRDRYDRRGGGNFIGASCGSDRVSAPSFGCSGSQNIEAFSVSEFFVSTEFDADLEFHYGMPDGSTCKSRSPCSSQGSRVINSQCGGAKNVSIVYPPQPKLPKTTCSIGIHTMSFSCQTKSTKPPPTYSTAPPTSTTTTTSSSVYKTTSSSPPVYKTTSSTSALQTTSTPTGCIPSTIYATTTSTVTKCGYGVSKCPSGNATTTVVTLAVSTVDCSTTTSQTLATSTETTSTSIETPPTYSATPPTYSESRSSYSASSPPASYSTETSTYSVGTVTTPSLPVSTLPCPEVVAQCLNTWLFSVTCSDNTDHGCYCPNEVFVENVFTCFYAHGETDTVISQAVLFFQGLCAQYVPSNPAVVTGATITSYITPTATPTYSAVYTTITLVATTTVPCTDEAGSTIAGSSSTLVYTTAMTAPQVGFSTYPTGGVGVVPITVPVEAGVTNSPQTTITYASPVGGGASGTASSTGYLVAPTSTPTGTVVTVNGSGRNSAFALAGLLVMAAVAAI